MSSRRARRRRPTRAPDELSADAQLNRVLAGTALVALGAALFGTLSYLSRSAAATGIEALSFVAWRAIVGSGALLAVSLVARRGIPDLRVLAADRRRALILAALCGALLNIAVFAAFLQTTIAIALICFYTFPAIVTLAAVPLYGERLTPIRLGALALSSAGLGVVVLAPVIGASGVVVDPVGVGLALAGAVFQASFVLIAGRGFGPMTNLHISTFVIAFAAAISIPLALFLGELPGLLRPLTDHSSWPWILAGGLIGAAIPTTAFITGIGLIGPSRAAVLMTIEPLVGVGLAALLLGEQPSVIQLLGGGAVLAGAAILQIAPSKKVVPEPEFGPVI
jgi:drug/metabolite transporter (DMT)-like permease